MHIAEIDQISISGDSPIHRAKAISKLLLAALLLISFIITYDIFKLSFLIGTLLILFIISRVPFKQVLHLVTYPIIFSIFFAFISLQQSWSFGIIVMQKAVGTAMTMILLITTTPYVDLFGVLSLFLPSLLVDLLLFTYRSLFILLGQIENLLKNLKLRGGYHPLKIISNLRNIAGAMGLLIIHSFEMSDRMYRVYSLRGYQGRIPLTVELWPIEKVDYILIIVGIITFVGTVIPWNL